jgi:hypothetical protein
MIRREPTVGRELESVAAQLAGGVQPLVVQTAHLRKAALAVPARNFLTI